MGWSRSEEVEAILKTALQRVYPERQKDAAKEIIREFENQFDFDTACELADSDHPAIRRAAEEINVEDEETMELSHKSL